MNDTTARDSEAVVHPAFLGLTPELTEPHPDRSHRALRSTVPILLVGSMAAMTLNLTGTVDPVEAKPPVKPRGATAQLGSTIKQAVAAASSAVRTAVTATSNTTPTAAPPTYTVAAGDTVSDIATRYGLSTASVLALNGLSWSSLIFPGQELKLTNGSALPTPPQESSNATPSGRYTIVAGDTISAIADRFGVSTLSVLTANGLGWSSIIYPGQTLAIPGLIGPGAPGPELDQAPERPAVEAPVEAAPEPPPAPEPAPVEPPAPAVGQYTVVSGDTLSGIAARYGIDTQSLLDANGLAWDSLIFTGDVLLIPGGSAPVSTGGSITYLDEEMRANAAIIVQVGRELGVPDYGIIIALATAMQESSMRNLDWGDRDSVGLFQQRPSSGWGSVEQLTTPAHAARLFYGGPSNPNAGYTRGLLDIAGWESMPLTVAAQAVQISAFPDAYAKWEDSARAWFAELG